MRSKIFTLSVLSMFILVAFAVFVSADITFNPTTLNESLTTGQTSITVNFDLVNDGIDGNITNLVWVGTSTGETWTVLPTLVDSINGTTDSLSATLTGISSTFVGTITGNINVDNGGSFSADLPITITVTAPIVPPEITVCEALGNPGKLEVKDIDFTNLGMPHLKNTDLTYKEFGDDDEWFILDDIEVDIEIENDGNEDVDDIVVEWGLYDTQANEWIIELDDEKDFNLKDRKDEILTINFNLEDDLDIDLEDLDDRDDYEFYVIATGVVDNDTADDTCAFDSETVEIVVESDFVVLSNVNFPESVMCGETVQVIANVWNIGDDDQEDVSIDLISKGIGVDIIVQIGDIDAFEDERLDFVFKVPNDAEEKFHIFTFIVLDEDNDVYENDYDDDESKFTLPIKVEGNCVSTSDATVIASLESGGKAGEELVVKATIVNTGDSTANYVINPSGYAEWASSAEVSPSTVTLSSGESRDVLITLNVKEDVSGEQLFNIELVSDNQLVVTQSVSVPIESKKTFRSFFTGGIIGSSNVYLWIIGALNVILIIAIIFVVVRLLRK